MLFIYKKELYILNVFVHLNKLLNKQSIFIDVETPYALCDVTTMIMMRICL